MRAAGVDRSDNRRQLWCRCIAFSRVDGDEGKESEWDDAIPSRCARSKDQNVWPQGCRLKDAFGGGDR